jgi:hypothetical protein
MGIVFARSAPKTGKVRLYVSTPRLAGRVNPQQKPIRAITGRKWHYAHKRHSAAKVQPQAACSFHSFII